MINTHDPLVMSAIYLAAMVVSVPITKKLGLGAVLGYLLVGGILGPSGLSILGHSTEQVLHFAEFGVIMMLFLIGLELKPSLLWKLRGPIFGLGGFQVGLTSVLGLAIGIAFGWTWQSALAVGMIFSLSSTAIVIQTLQEKGLLKTTGGETAFSVLLFQDIAVIPMLAFFPLLGTLAPNGAVSASQGWIQAAKVVAAIGIVIVIGRYLIGPLFRLIALSKLRELFTAMALLIVAAISLLMNSVGLSPALGAFLAGVVLANSEYRHQLEVDIEPFKGLLLGVFFISVGSEIDIAVMKNYPLMILLGVFLTVLLKAGTLGLVGKIGHLPRVDLFLFSFALAQGGEFAFVLLKYGETQGILSTLFVQQLSAIVALSMLSTPFMMKLYEKVLLPILTPKTEKRKADEIDEKDSPVIVAGFGRFGQMATRLLRGAGIKTTVLDYDADQVDIVQRFGMKAFYGDASNMDLLRSAGAENAKLLIIAIDDAPKALEIIDQVKKEFPQLKILARAYDRIQAYEMIHRGIEYPYIETSGSALALGVAALRVLGFPAKQAHQAGHIFKRRNDESIQSLAKVYQEDDENSFLSHAKNWVSVLENALQKDILELKRDADRAWESAPRNK